MLDQTIVEIIFISSRNIE